MPSNMPSSAVEAGADLISILRMDRLGAEAGGNPSVNTEPRLPQNLFEHFELARTSDKFTDWLPDQPMRLWSVNCDRFKPRLLACLVNENDEARAIMEDRSLQTRVSDAVAGACKKTAERELALIVYGDTFPYGRAPNTPAAVFMCIHDADLRQQLRDGIEKSSLVKLTDVIEGDDVIVATSNAVFPLPVRKAKMPEAAPEAWVGLFRALNTHK